MAIISSSLGKRMISRVFALISQSAPARRPACFCCSPPQVYPHRAACSHGSILPNFIMVAALGALCVFFGGLRWMTATFYGVSPAVIGLILHSYWRLAKLGRQDCLKWVIAAVCCVVKKPEGLLALAPLAVGTSKARTVTVLGRLGAFFLKAGSLTFGSGLLIVPYLEKGLVQQMGGLTAASS